MNNDKKRGEFLYELRKNKGLTQKELGDLIHYSDKNISKWERGISFPNNPNILNELAKIFDIGIEELMYGERKEEDNQKLISDNFNNVFRKNYNKYRKNISILLTVLLSVIILSLLAIYLIFIRNSVKIYTISFDNKNVNEINSTLLITNKVNILNFNKIESKSDKEIINVIAYYKSSNDNITKIFSGENKDYYIEEANGYKEYNLNDLIKKDVFIDITYDDDTTETLKLIFQEKYRNDNVFPKLKEDSINKKSNSSSNIESKLSKLGFDHEESTYKQILNSETIVTYNTDTNQININIQKNDTIENIFNNINTNNIFYEKLNKGELVENIEITVKESKNCNEEKCSSKEDYAMYIKFLKGIINSK